MRKLADGIWFVDDLLTGTETESIIEQAEAKGFALARLADSGRQNSEVFLRREDIRSELGLQLQRVFAVSAVELPNVFECYRYSPGATVVAHSDAPTRIAHTLSVMTLVVYLNDKFA